MTHRLLSALFALALLALAVFVVVDLILAALDESPWLVDWRGVPTQLRSRSFDDPWVLGVSAAVVVLGLVLLVIALRRGGPSEIPLTPDVDAVELTASRRSLQRMLAATASRQDGVSGASAHATRRSVKVSVDTAMRDSGDLSSRVSGAVEEQLERLRPARRLSTSVSIHQEQS